MSWGNPQGGVSGKGEGVERDGEPKKGGKRSPKGLNPNYSANNG